jgi:hypothetical protein
MKIKMDQKSMPVLKIVGSLVGSVLGGLIGFAISRKFDQKALLNPSDSLKFEKQKKNVLSMIDSARDKYKDKLNIPIKNDVKSRIKKENHSVKPMTKRSF